MRATMNISLPPQLKAWLEEQVEQEGYGTASEYVRELLRRQRQSQDARAKIESKLLAALESGESTPMSARDWKRIKVQGLKRLRAEKKRRT
ncbi:MAG: type II toxin-antitoxin system ParD family antitoxin [Tepidisphaeraceae bacterium]